MGTAPLQQRLDTYQCQPENQEPGHVGHGHALQASIYINLRVLMAHLKNGASQIAGSAAKNSNFGTIKDAVTSPITDFTCVECRSKNCNFYLAKACPTPISN